MFKKISTQSLMAIGVLTVSFMALFVSIRQTAIMGEQTKLLIEQNKANAWPHLALQLSRGFDKEGINRFAISIGNQGTGPAIIDAVKVSYEGTAVRNWIDFYRVAGVPDSIRFGGHSNASLYNEVIPENTGHTIISWDNNPGLMRWIYEHGDKITFEICYRSVFGDRWKIKRIGFRTNLEVSTTEKVENCNVSTDQRFME